MIESPAPRACAAAPAMEARVAPGSGELFGVFGPVLEQLSVAIEELQQVDVTALSDAQVAASLQELERQARRLPSVRNALVAEVVERALPAVARQPSVGAYLRSLIQVTSFEGKSLARDAEDLAPRRCLSTGETLPPRHEHVAAAVADGTITTAHARMINDTLRRVPAAVPSDEVTAGEARLVRAARMFDTHGLDRLCRRFLDCVDPDGSLRRDPVEQARRRELRIGRQGKDGMYPVRGRLDEHTGALVRAALDHLAAPEPAPDGAPDTRAPEQRDHDALRELARRALAGGDLPVRHGLPATLLLTMKLTDLEARTGYATTAHGGTYSVREVLRHAADTGVVPVVMDSDGMVLHCGEEQRLGTIGQRRALNVMDVGCTWPGCNIPGVWCECAHCEPFRTSRRTTIDDLALLCGYHHDIVDNEEWTIERIRGRVWFTPPAWIDPAQVPRTNEYWKPLE